MNQHKTQIAFIFCVTLKQNTFQSFLYIQCFEATHVHKCPPTALILVLSFLQTFKSIQKVTEKCKYIVYTDRQMLDCTT